MASPPLPGVFADLAPVLDHWGYIAVGGLVLIEDFGIPVPGETILIAAAVYGGAGRLNLLVVAVVAFAAAVIGDNIGYAIGRYGGQPLVERWGRFVFLTPDRVDRAVSFFARHGGKLVTVARFIEGLRQANGLAAGIARMPWRRFLVFNVLGAALWVGVWVTVGAVAGKHLKTLYPVIQQYEVYLFVAAAVVIVLLVARHLYRRRRGAGRN